ncbi:MAG: hypothetical protein KF852_05145 [Saprospiraceae bacterium]|nr:hypothetical protein [Saprospiraceae bacterium]
MRLLLVITIVVFLLACHNTDSNGQSTPEKTRPAAVQAIEEPARPAPASIPDLSLYRDLYQKHDTYKEKTITKQRFKHADIVPLVQRLKAPLSFALAGKSIEGRSIYKVQYGDGPVKVLLWSQMHGDEPTATMALMDIFNFLSRSDEFDELRNRLRRELTLVFVPMLNPDGAQRFERRNALGIDLNRDALRLQCPESKILKGLRDELSATWGFNLHDQNRYYGAGLAPKNAAISFLAPAYNYEKDINDVRGNAMRLIVGMNALMQEYIPGNVARYDDEFEPRAFGDNIQRWGTSAILIEAGALPGDPEKQALRRLHFSALLFALDAIAQKHIERFDIAGYEDIPFNKSNFFHDLIVREAEIEKAGQRYTVDIGFRHSTTASGVQSSSISDLGDLSIFHGYQEAPARGMRLVPGKTYPKVLPDITALKSIDALDLMRQGYTEIQLTKLPPQLPAGAFPFRLVAPGKGGAGEIKVGRNPSFVLMKDGKVRWSVVNGAAFDLGKDADTIRATVKK